MSLTVLQVLPALNVGGVERGTLEVAAELASRGHRSLVISAGGKLVNQLVKEGSEHFTMPIGKKNPLTLLLIGKLRKFLMNENVSVIHARSRMPAWIAYLAWRGMDKKLRPGFVTTVHGPYTVNPYSAVMTYGEQVIAISQFINNYIKDSYPSTDSKKIKIIYRGIDQNVFKYGFIPDESWQSRWHTEFPQLKNKFLVTLPARITRWKGHEDFVEIISLLVNKNIPVHGIIAGGYEKKQGGFYNQLQNMVQNYNLDKNITFTGHRSDLREIMAISDVVVSLAKEPEAFGRTALEALSLGIPVVAYDHGGASEILRKLFAQGLVTKNDIESAAKKIAELFYTKSIPEKNNYFSLQKMLDDTLNIYNELTT